MYIKVVVKMGFFVGNVGCGSLRDTPECQEERTCICDPFTLTAAGSLPFFSL